MQEVPQPVSEKGNFDAVKNYILKHIIKDAKVKSMLILYKLYGLSVGVSRYCNKLHKKKERQISQQNPQIFNVSSVPQITWFFSAEAIISGKINRCCGSNKQKRNKGKVKNKTM